MRSRFQVLSGLAALAILSSACSSAATSAGPTSADTTAPTEAPSSDAGASTEPTAAPSVDTTPVTIKVWDYYGDTTPIKPALDGFKKEFPWITVDYQALDWDSMNEKFKAGLGAGDVPDLATLDMTWIPTLAANGALDDLGPISGGQLNGKPIKDQYTKGALDAMTYGDQMVSALYDFDTYALYYRKDLLDAKGIAVPTNWDEFRAAAKALAESSKPGGKPDKYLTAIRPNSFHFSQYLYQDGGSLLNDGNTEAVFNSPGRGRRGQHPEGHPRRRQRQVLAGCQQRPVAGDQVGRGGDVPGRPLLHGPAQERRARAVGQVGRGHGAILEAARAATSAGPVWASPSRRPTRTQPGSWPSTCSGPRTRSTCSTIAGAAPATTAALNSPDLTKPDPYFGGQQPFSVFLESMKTSRPFPYVGTWDDIDLAIADAMQKALLGKADVQKALDDAVNETNTLLNK